MLADYRRYAETLWHGPSEALPGMGYWGTGRGDWNNEGVRAGSTTALVYALLWREGDHTFRIADRVDPALRYAAAIHTTGDRKDTSGKTWGDSWQSAMWAANLGVTAWLVRDQISPQTLAAVRRVVADEADRFIAGGPLAAPPTKLPGDTKAEENAWDLTVPAAALLLMPDSPHAAAWNEAVLRYGFNTLSVAADRTSQTVADGKPIRDWVTTTQLFPDYTLENHNIFHPVYAMVAPATMAQTAVVYRLAGRPVPDALLYNVAPEWRMLQSITQADGEWLYPQGLDWDLHDYEHLHYWTLLATLRHDPVAALMERRTLGYARRRQEGNGDGRFVGPTSSLGFAREAVQAERVAFALLMHEQFGPPPAASDADWRRMVRSLPPAQVFPYVGFAVYRGPRGLLSFSWKHHLMGVIGPESETHMDSPYVTTPNLESVVGRFRLEGQSDREAAGFSVAAHRIDAATQGFAATIDATINGGRLHQQIAVAAIAPGILAYLDHVTANADIVVLEERGLTIGIENDTVSGGKRQIAGADGATRTVVGGGAAGDHPLPGNWANIDGRLGLISTPGSPLLYRAAGKPNRPGAREDLLIGAFRGERRPVPAGAVVAERAGLILPGASPEETARLAQRFTVKRDAQSGATLQFQGTDGRVHTLLLRPDGTGRWDGKEIRGGDADNSSPRREERS